jgi:phage-related protein
MNEKRLPARFYQTEIGNEPVREWLKELEVSDRKIIGIDIKTVEYGYPIGMPICRSMGKGIYEVRSNLPNGKIARVFFCIYKENMILLHGFIKKTQKTPIQDLNLAIKRKSILEAKND